LLNLSQTLSRNLSQTRSQTLTHTFSFAGTFHTVDASALAALSEGYIVDDDGTPDLVPHKVLPQVRGLLHY
jgi:hypothetical protein